jgi:hypothetical protein
MTIRAVVNSHSEFIPEGHTVNKEMYVDILRCLREMQGEGNVHNNVHETVGFFCMTTHPHIGYWWSKSTLPSTL